MLRSVAGAASNSYWISITGGRTGAVEATGAKKKRHWSKGEIFPISRVTRRDLSRMVRSIPLN